MNCPLPRYWQCHALVALLIAVAVWPFLGLQSGLAGGACFYIGREYTQWEQGDGPGLPFDWKGVAAPVAACLTVLAIKVYLVGL